MCLNFDKVDLSNISHIETVLNKMGYVLVLILHQNQQSIVGQNHESRGSIKPKFLIFLINNSIHFHLLNQRNSSFFSLHKLRHFLLKISALFDILFYILNNPSN